MMKYKFILVVISLMILQSCVVYNTTKNIDQKICLIHNENLKKLLVRAKYGHDCIGNKSAFINAKREKCIEGKKPLWPLNRMALVYHCQSCDKIKKEIQKSEK